MDILRDQSLWSFVPIKEKVHSNKKTNAWFVQSRNTNFHQIRSLSKVWNGFLMSAMVKPNFIQTFTNMTTPYFQHYLLKLSKLCPCLSQSNLYTASTKSYTNAHKFLFTLISLFNVNSTFENFPFQKLKSFLLH